MSIFPLSWPGSGVPVLERPQECRSSSQLPPPQLPVLQPDFSSPQNKAPHCSGENGKESVTEQPEPSREGVPAPTASLRGHPPPAQPLAPIFLVVAPCQPRGSRESIGNAGVFPRVPIFVAFVTRGFGRAEVSAGNAIPESSCSLEKGAPKIGKGGSQK